MASTSQLCDHCRLPLRRRLRGRVDGEALVFCCYGCVLAHQITNARGEGGAAASILIRLGLAVFFSMNVMMLSMPTYAPYIYGSASESADGPFFHVLRWLALAFTLPVIALLGLPILATAVRGLRTGLAASDALIVLGSAASVGLSSYHTWIGAGPVYFETACVLLVLVTLGRYLEAQARADATEALRAGLIAPSATAVRVRDGCATNVAIATIVPDDLLRVYAGERFPSDGIVIDGEGSADEAALTGENRPVWKEPGSAVAGGTCSIDGCFTVRVTARPTDSAAARVMRLLEQAARQRGRFERLADRLATAFVPAAILLAAASGWWWSARAGYDQGVMTFLSVLAVACPCALGIATPLAVWAGLATAAKRGLVIRNATVLERLGSVRHILFDKTGTLTDRRLKLRQIRVLDERGLGAEAERAALSSAAALEAGLQHPIALALTEACGPTVAASTDRRVVPGRGVLGRVGGIQLALGSLTHPPVDLDPSALGAPPGEMVVALFQARAPIALFYFTEELRADAAQALALLRNRGIKVELLSGDSQAAVLVPKLFRPGEARLGLLPEDKLARVRELHGTGVAMVGDGLNDAPALAAADIGIAVGNATDITRMTADVALLGDALEGIPWLLQHATRVNRVVRQNLVWAFGYNAVALLLAALGQLNPIVASLAMLASSAAVVANSRRLGRATPAPLSRIAAGEGQGEGAFREPYVCVAARN